VQSLQKLKTENVQNLTQLREDGVPRNISAIYLKKKKKEKKTKKETKRKDA